jgi:predicted RNA binding protein YcfA (HicA-like mRNA interferase family)/predicted RNase H-like HicB family nuclease
MLTNSRDIIRRLEREGWRLVRVTGSHHVFKSSISGETVVIPHPKKDLGKGLVRAIYKGQAGNLTEAAMAHYIAIIEDAGPDHAVGVWFPDLPGCTSAGDNIDDALRNAPEALELYAESFEADGKPLPLPRTLTELKADPEIADDIKAYMVALVEFPARAHAAE